MSRLFLTAEWRNLLMANFEIDPAVLKKYLTRYTERDSFHGIHYVSRVGVLLKDTKVYGISFPFYRHFEEVNLRFYVRYKKDLLWKRGVVFVKEIVPKRMITFVANTLYREKYATHAMKHSWQTSDEGVDVEYRWKVGPEWNHLKVLADQGALPVVQGSKEEFITEHYWGYTSVSDQCTGEYEVVHPKWNVHKVKRFEAKCSAGKLYGNDFVDCFSQKPKSVFLAEGSAIQVMKGSKIFLKQTIQQ